MGVSVFFYAMSPKEFRAWRAKLLKFHPQVGLKIDRVEHVESVKGNELIPLGNEGVRNKVTLEWAQFLALVEG